MKLINQQIKRLRIWGLLHGASLPQLLWVTDNCSVSNKVYLKADNIKFNKRKQSDCVEATCYCFRKALLRTVPLQELDLLVDHLHR